MILFRGRWWPETESNCRHEDFQSTALPTELSGHQNFKCEIISNLSDL